MPLVSGADPAKPPTQPGDSLSIHDNPPRWVEGVEFDPIAPYPTNTTFVGAARDEPHRYGGPYRPCDPVEKFYFRAFRIS